MSDKILSPDEFRDLRADDPKAADAAYEVLRKRVTELEAGLREAEDFRVEIAVDAFTAPDADWGTILDSLRARIRDLGGGIPEDGCYQDHGICSYCDGRGCEACDARALLGGVPAAAPEVYTLADAVRDVAIEDGKACPRCGSGDRSRYSRGCCFCSADPWHGGETKETP